LKIAWRRAHGFGLVLIESATLHFGMALRDAIAEHSG
jgi:hypothetical protein